VTLFELLSNCFSTITRIDKNSAEHSDHIMYRQKSWNTHLMCCVANYCIYFQWSRAMFQHELRMSYSFYSFTNLRYACVYTDYIYRLQLRCWKNDLGMFTDFLRNKIMVIFSQCLKRPQTVIRDWNYITIYFWFYLLLEFVLIKNVLSKYYLMHRRYSLCVLGGEA
jgi:hypothetical protein